MVYVYNDLVFVLLTNRFVVANACVTCEIHVFHHVCIEFSIPFSACVFLHKNNNIYSKVLDEMYSRQILLFLFLRENTCCGYNVLIRIARRGNLNKYLLH